MVESVELVVFLMGELVSVSMVNLNLWYISHTANFVNRTKL